MTHSQTQVNNITEEVRTSLMFQYLVEDPFHSPTFNGMVRVTDTETLVVDGNWRHPRLDLSDELIHTLFDEWRAYNGL